jgi:hypothetical protein
MFFFGFLRISTVITWISTKNFKIGGTSLIKKHKDDQEATPPRPSRVLFEFTSEDEAYVNMMLKKSARRTVQKHRKDKPLPTKEPLFIDDELDEMLIEVEKKAGIKSTATEPIKNCRKCYFSRSFRVIGVDWYCHCANVARSSAKAGWSWVRCESNLSCWREPDYDSF